VLGADTRGIIGLDYAVVAQEQFGQADRTFLVIVADVAPIQGQA
jgi:hypothetical protein